jgi:O-antigen ligase
MRAILVILIVCLIGKDVAFAPFPNVLRGAAQALCFAAGLIYLLPVLSAQLLAGYWPLIAYLVVLMLGVPFTPFPVFVFLQVLSLTSVVVFFVAYLETRQLVLERDVAQVVRCTILVYGIVIYASLILIKLQPTLAYDSMFAGDETGYEIRFRGMFSRSGVMAAASGLLVGLAAISVKRWPQKVLLVVPGLVCLVLTQSRSFWLAGFIAGAVTAWIYYPRLRKWIYASVGTLVFMAAVSAALNITVDTSGIHTFARLDSVRDLTGRTELWQSAYKGWSARPWLGYGFTLGGLGLQRDHLIAADADPTTFSRMTLHNGYIQSLLDSGLVGVVFYLLAILIAITRILRFDSKRRFPEVLYVLLYLSIANGGESVIYSGSVFQSLCFWIFAVFAMRLTSRDRDAPLAESRESPSVAASRPPNLMR